MVSGWLIATVLLALVSDLIHHLLNAYIINGLAVHDTNGHLSMNRSGVVLIDEVDAHLHPEWQREIGFWLKRSFPKIQFLVTTHSPIICQAADANGLFVLAESEQREAYTTLPPRRQVQQQHRPQQ